VITPILIIIIFLSTFVNISVQNSGAYTKNQANKSIFEESTVPLLFSIIAHTRTFVNFFHVSKRQKDLVSFANPSSHGIFFNYKFSKINPFHVI